MKKLSLKDIKSGTLMGKPEPVTVQIKVNGEAMEFDTHVLPFSYSTAVAQMKEERIKQIKQTTAETDLRIATMKKGIQVSDEQIKSIANQIWISREANARGERSVDIDARDLARKISETEFKTNDAEHVKQWTSIITDLLKVIK